MILDSLSFSLAHTLISSASVGAEEIVDGILDHHYYDEKMVHRLVVAASEKLGKPTEFHLESL